MSNMDKLHTTPVCLVASYIIGTWNVQVGISEFVKFFVYLSSQVPSVKDGVTGYYKYQEKLHAHVKINYTKYRI